MSKKGSLINHIQRSKAYLYTCIRLCSCFRPHLSMITFNQWENETEIILNRSGVKFIWDFFNWKNHIYIFQLNWNPF